MEKLVKIKFLILSACLGISLLSAAGEQDGMNWEQPVKFTIHAQEDYDHYLTLSSNMTYRELKEVVASVFHEDNFLLIAQQKPFELDSDEQIDLEEIKRVGVSIILK